MTPLEAAKEQIGTIEELLRLRGWGWQPGRSCHVPYREDRNKSSSVFADGKLFRDFASGETFDMPALLAKVEKTSNKAACRLLIEIAGTAADRTLARKPAPPVFQFRPKSKPNLPKLRVITEDELRELATSRGISVKLGNEKRFILTDLERFKEASTVKAA
jgi:hypothetical protein